MLQERTRTQSFVRLGLLSGSWTDKNDGRDCKEHDSLPLSVGAGVDQVYRLCQRPCRLLLL